MHYRKDHIDALGLSAFTQANQRATAARICRIRRKHDCRRVFEDGQRLLSFQQRNIVEMPAPLLIDGYRHDFEALPIEVINYGRSCLKRNFMFSLTAAVQDRPAYVLYTPL